MTATEFFRRCRENEQVLCQAIEKWHPEKWISPGFFYFSLSGSFSPRYAFTRALNALDYPSAHEILVKTRAHVPIDANRPLYELLYDLTEETKMTKKIRKFYIGSSSVAQAIRDGNNSRITHDTVEGAVAEAKARIESGEFEQAIVVEIVRVIRKEIPKPPVTVEEI